MRERWALLRPRLPLPVPFSEPPREEETLVWLVNLQSRQLDHADVWMEWLRGETLCMSRGGSLSLFHSWIRAAGGSICVKALPGTWHFLLLWFSLFSFSSVLRGWTVLKTLASWMRCLSLEHLDHVLQLGLHQSSEIKSQKHTEVLWFTFYYCCLCEQETVYLYDKNEANKCIFFLYYPSGSSKPNVRLNFCVCEEPLGFVNLCS